MPKLTYTWRMRLYLGSSVVMTVAFGLVAGNLSKLGESGEYFWIVVPVLLAMAVPLAGLVWIWWRAMDDVQKAGQTNSWYWGGSVGAFLFVVYLIAERAQHSEFGLGAFAMFMAQCAGFVLMWTVWKLRGMARAE